MDLGIAGRVCVVTGGSRGIGLETARLLRAEDAKVLLVARDAARLADAAEGLDGGDEEIATLPLDITEPDAGDQMLGAALEAFGGIDVLVNNAGAARYRDFLEVPDKDWRAQYELNVMGPMWAMKAIAPVLAERWLEPGGLLDQHIEATGGGDREAALAQVSAGKPNGRPASAEEIAATIVFLCSERASYVAGAAWSVDAGTVQVII
jgi:NAD(P)-dependent dehydrogenase (short-subunit alcohol dehydrogenase family)